MPADRRERTPTAFGFPEPAGRPIGDSLPSIGLTELATAARGGTTERMSNVVVIGAGLSGLSAAYLTGQES